MKDAIAIAEDFRNYAYSVSHDVSGPVRAMVEFSRILSEEEPEALSPEGREYLALIVENGRKLQAMIDGLLEYSRLNTQLMPLMALDMDTAVNETCQALRSRIVASGATITSTPLPPIQGDARQIRLLLRVLLENALTYQSSGTPPQIHISGKADDASNQLALEIRDNGIGVPEAFREVIFQPFKRLHTAEEYPGTGMGLTLARKILEHHGGSVECRANHPHGSVFLVHLPLYGA